jgi:hypothetical protein
MLRRVSAAVLALAACAAGCGSYPPSPSQIAQDYVSAIAEGNYAGACAILGRPARESLSAFTRSSASCPTLLRRCLPTQAAVLRRDQVQLFYANVSVTTAGSTASVRTSGTAAANRIRELTLAKNGARWELTSYGRVRCPRSRGR